jgi:hypothetical protein
MQTTKQSQNYKHKIINSAHHHNFDHHLTSHSTIERSSLPPLNSGTGSGGCGGVYSSSRNSSDISSSDSTGSSSIISNSPLQTTQITHSTSASNTISHNTPLQTPAAPNQLTVCCDTNELSHNNQMQTNNNTTSASHTYFNQHQNSSFNTNNYTNSRLINHYNLNSNRSSISNQTSNTIKSDMLLNNNNKINFSSHIQPNLNLITSNSLFSSSSNANTLNRKNMMGILKTTGFNLDFEDLNLDLLDIENDDLASNMADQYDGDDALNSVDPDYIISTSSNLEFLKAHSLFNKTSLNYYPPLLNINNNNNNSDRIDVKIDSSNSISKTSHQPLSTLATLSESKSVNTQLILPHHNQPNQNSSNSSVVDFRFSTFLPPLPTQSNYGKNNTLNNHNEIL